MEYVISDTHFFHEQLLGVDQFAPRPYQTVEDDGGGLERPGKRK